MRAIILGALILANGAWVAGFQRQGSQPGMGGAGTTSGTQGGTADVRSGTGGGGPLAPGAGRSDEQRSWMGAAALGSFGVASVSGVQLPQEAPPPEDIADDTLPHTNPEFHEGIGGSGPPVPDEDSDALSPEEQEASEEFIIIVPEQEALKSLSLPREGVGGSGSEELPPGRSAQQAASERPLNPLVGQVQSRGPDQLVVRDVERGTFALTLDPKSCISRNGQTLSVNQLDAGDAVRAGWGLRDGQRVVTWVEILRDSQGPGGGQGP